MEIGITPSPEYEPPMLAFDKTTPEESERHMKTNEEITKMISEMEAKLAETKDSAVWNSGPVPDALKVVIPMMEDNLAITKALLEVVKTTIVINNFAVDRGELKSAPNTHSTIPPE